MTPIVSIALVFLAAVAFFFLRHKPWLAALFVALAALPWVMGSPAAALILALLLLGILLAQPLYVLLGVVTLVCLAFLLESPPDEYGIFAEKIYELTDKNVLLAIPFFVISGAIMAKGGIAKRLINVAAALTDWLPGGLGIAAVGGCVLFAAISGSSPVTVIAIGGMMYPTLRQLDSDRQAVGLLTSAGSLGIVIPPSIPMIIYAIVVSGQQAIDVGDLFLAGLGPGLLIGGLLCSLVVGRALRQSEDLPGDLRRMAKGFGVVLAPLLVAAVLAESWHPGALALGPVALLGLALWRAPKALLDGFWALMLPVLILGGIYGGLFTPTEAAALSVLYAVVVSVFLYGELSLRELPKLVTESTVMMGSLIVIMVIAFVFNDYLVEAKIPERGVALIEDLSLGRGGFLIVLNILLIAVGCFMDIISAILIIVPLVVPMAMAPGIDIDPIHLGIIFIVNLEIGYLTPPLGLNLFVASTLFGKSIGEVVRAVIPYTLVMVVGILVITYVPKVALGPGEWIASLSGTQEPAKEILSIEEMMKAQGMDGDLDADDLDDEDLDDEDLDEVDLDGEDADDDVDQVEKNPAPTSPPQNQQ